MSSIRIDDAPVLARSDAFAGSRRRPKASTVGVSALDISLCAIAPLCASESVDISDMAGFAELEAVDSILSYVVCRLLKCTDLADVANLRCFVDSQLAEIDCFDFDEMCPIDRVILEPRCLALSERAQLVSSRVSDLESAFAVDEDVQPVSYVDPVVPDSPNSHVSCLCLFVYYWCFCFYVFMFLCFC
jgi:hypothetical protein